MTRSAPGPTDEVFASLLVAAQAKSGWACTQLWNDYAPAVASFLAARGSREADDLTSEVFLVVFDRLASFQGDSSAFRSFVFSIAYRRLVDELRARGRRGESIEYDDVDDPRRSSSAEDVAIERLGNSRALTLLRNLPPDQRDVMLLRIMADLTVEQVAVVLGKQPGAIKALQRRALTQLRKKILDPRTPRGHADDSGE